MITLSVECAMMGSIVDVPVRHTNLSKINCLFELEYWCLFAEDVRDNRPKEYYYFKIIF
jgi:hypothetical protein